LVIESIEIRSIKFYHLHFFQVPVSTTTKSFSRITIQENKEGGIASRNTRLRIGVNASMLDSKPTGVGVFTYNLINHMHLLLKEDHQIDLTVFSPVDKHLEPGIRVQRIPSALQSSEYPRSSAISRLAWNQLMYPVVARNMDILLNPSTHGHLWPGKQVLTIHDLLSLRFNNISGHQRLYFQNVLPRMIRQSAAVITVSECTKQEVIRHFGTQADKIRVINNGFDRRNFCPSLAGSQKILDRYGVSGYILAVGPTYPHKNFGTLFQAYAQFSSRERKQYPLLIAGGRPSYIAQLRKLSDHAGLSQYIHFTGYVPQELMPALYQEARLLVFPSLYEGFGIPLLEAMGCGCPIVCSDTSSMPEVCGNAAIYADALKPDSMHAGMKVVLENESLCTLLRKNGLSRAKHFSWERAASEVIQLMREISAK
jgi:glycosyltransferase involved in cell wall biosynthesis